MSSCTFIIRSDSTVTFYPNQPDTITYADGRTLTRLNLWNDQYISDSGKETESMAMVGFETSKTIINYMDTVTDAGDEWTISGFGNTDIDGIWVCESFSYTCDVPGGYTYTLQMERVR